MTDISNLIQNSGTLDIADAIRAGISKGRFYAYVKKNHLVKAGNGVYLTQDGWIDDLYILHKRCPNAIFSHEEALFYYDLVDREPIQHVLTIYTGYNTKRLTESGCKVYTIKKELLSLGKVFVYDFRGNEVPMYNLERTICDMIRSRSQIEIQDFTSALKAYVRRPEKDLNRLLQYSQIFHIERILRNYMEVLL